MLGGQIDGADRSLPNILAPMVAGLMSLVPEVEQSLPTLLLPVKRMEVARPIINWKYWVS